MRREPGFIGIDRFRMAAALLVVAVHTSPLLSFGDFPDYLLTRVVARLGVPFFFAVSGFFLLAPYAGEKSRSAGPIAGFVRKTAAIYGVAVLLYLPVNLYAGHFATGSPFTTVLRLLLVDGTMYHLWYLPAAVLGVCVVWLLLRVSSIKMATVVSCLLYVLGLLGDAYYGVAAATPVLKALYGGVFAVSSYTRNGLFMAPVFLVVGVWAARRPASRSRALAGFLVSLGLLLLEGIMIYGLPGKRHDSMYIALPLCVFCLMRWLAAFRGPSSKTLRAVSLIVYVVHPLAIIAVRGAAKLAGLAAVLVDNSLLHYVLVCAVSITAALLLLWAKEVLLNARHKAARVDRG